jgi:hypothetical protein
LLRSSEVNQRIEARELEKRNKGKSKYIDEDRDKSESQGEDEGEDEDKGKDEDRGGVGSRYLCSCNKQITV